MSLAVNCINNDLSADALIKIVTVDSTGEPYFTCDNQFISLEDLARLLIGTDVDGNPALRVYQP